LPLAAFLGFLVVVVLAILVRTPWFDDAVVNFWNWLSQRGKAGNRKMKLGRGTFVAPAPDLKLALVLWPGSSGTAQAILTAGGADAA
jgi:hypothetical protein